MTSTEREGLAERLADEVEYRVRTAVALSKAGSVKGVKEEVDAGRARVKSLLDIPDRLHPTPVSVTTVEELLAATFAMVDAQRALGEACEVPEGAPSLFDEGYEAWRQSDECRAHSESGQAERVKVSAAMKRHEDAADAYYEFCFHKHPAPECDVETVERLIATVDESPAVLWGGTGGAREVLRAALNAAIAD